MNKDSLLKFQRKNGRVYFIGQEPILSEDEIKQLKYDEDLEKYYLGNDIIEEINFETGEGIISKPDSIIYTRKGRINLKSCEETAIMQKCRYRAAEYLNIPMDDWLILLDLKIYRKYVHKLGKSLESFGVVEVSVEEAEKHRYSSYRNNKFYVYKEEKNKDITIY